jgi:hypothetical protein
LRLLEQHPRDGQALLLAAAELLAPGIGLVQAVDQVGQQGLVQGLVQGSSV